MPVKGPTVEFPAKAIKETDKALLCAIGELEIWIPQSQIYDDSEVWKEDDEGTLVISEWIAKQKGLI